MNRLLLGSFALILFAGQAPAAEIHVVSSGGFAAAYKQLAPEFEKQTGNRVDSAWGPSMGDTHDAVPQRLARGEPIDVVIMVGYALDQLVQQGKVIPDLIQWWCERDRVKPDKSRNGKGSTWVLSMREGRLLEADHIASPLPPDPG